MPYRLFISAVLLVASALSVNQAIGAVAPLTLAQSVQLPQVTGGTNHLAADTKRRRLFVTAPGDKKVVVVDLVAGRVLKVMDDVPAAAAVFLPDDRVCLSGRGGVAFYQADSLAPLGKVDLHGPVDELHYDPHSKRIYAGFMDIKDPGIAVIDAAGLKLLQRLKLPAKPQGFVLEQHGPRIYVNTPAAGQVTVLDRDRGAIVAQWKLPQAQGNYPIALDESAHRVFVGCRRPAQVLVLDSGSGKLIASVPSGGDADDMSFDPKMRRIYLSCGDGLVCTVQQVGGNEYKRLDDTPSAEDARNSLFVPELDTFYVAIPRRANRPPELRSYRAHG